MRRERSARVLYLQPAWALLDVSTGLQGARRSNCAQYALRCYIVLEHIMMRIVFHIGSSCLHVVSKHAWRTLRHIIGQPQRATHSAKRQRDDICVARCGNYRVPVSAPESCDGNAEVHGLRRRLSYLSLADPCCRRIGRHYLEHNNVPATRMVEFDDDQPDVTDPLKQATTCPRCSSAYC